MLTMKEVKEEVEKRTGARLDFRKDVYLPNMFGLGPVYSYSVGLKVVKFLIEKSSGARNVKMEIEKLRSTKLKTYIEDLIELINRK